ncbi:MAG TPA: DNA primase [Acidimicrobiia bacterium]|nr:DNA primase [Acidimicrobiia bacterium]
MTERGDIDRVREATDLVELVSEVTQVKKSGRSYMAVCPFHEEKTPSMSIDRARGLYHCFGCGKGGDVFEFVQETRGVDFREALDLLASKAGITLVRDPADAKTRGRRAAAIDALRRAVDVYHQRLKKAQDGGPARSYLRSRGYDVDLIDEWKLGFAGTDWDTLAKNLRTGGIEERALIDAGLGRRGRHGVYDFFRGRLMFPIHDLRGDPIGFGGRKIDEVDRNSTNNPDAKYVNSADSPVYQKSRVLFGLDRARQSMDDENPAVIVEGYTDVIAMHQAGVTTAVATCGTALGEGHFDLLRRFTERVVLAFDSDEAGSRAALRSDDLESPFRLDLDLRVATMPDGLDPADLYQEGRGDELAKAVKTARPLLEHRIEKEVSRHDLSGPESRARALHAAVEHLRRVNDPIARGEYNRYVARLVGVDLSTVEDALRGTGGRRAESGPARETPLDRAEAELFRVVLNNPAGMDVTVEDFQDPRLRRAINAIAGQLASNPPGVPVDPSRVEDPTLQALVRALAMDGRPLPDWAEMNTRVRLRRIEAEIDALEAELAREDADSSETYSEKLRRLIALQQEKHSLSQ